MRTIFISNTKIIFPGFENIKIDQGKELDSQLAEIYTSGNNVFIIDLHVCFQKDALYMQDFGGFIIYNRLFWLFGNNVTNLKVIFYTPLRWALVEKIYKPNLVRRDIPHFETFNFNINWEYFFDYEISMDIWNREKSNSWCKSIIFRINPKQKFNPKLEDVMMPFKRFSPFHIGQLIYQCKSRLLEHFGLKNYRSLAEEEEDVE